jgi:hypothetical protein
MDGFACCVRIDVAKMLSAFRKTDGTFPLEAFKFTVSDGEI